MNKKYYSEKFFTDLIGKRFGKLVGVSFDSFKPLPCGKGRSFWKVKCDCGEEKVVDRNRLKSGRLIHCGCLSESLRGVSNRKTVGNVSGTLWNRITNNAKARQIPVTITHKEIADLYTRQNGVCAVSGQPLRISTVRTGLTGVTASLDRIDSSLGYVSGNVQWVHKAINKMKNNSSESEFFEWVKKIYHHRHLDM